MTMFQVNRFPSLSHPLNWAQNMATHISCCYKKLDVNQYVLGRQFSHSLSLSKFEVVAHHGIQTQSTMHLWYFFPLYVNGNTQHLSFFVFQGQA